MILYRKGLVYVEGETIAGATTSTLATTRRKTRSVRLSMGQPVMVGPYRMQLIPAPPGCDAALQLEYVGGAEIAGDFRSRTAGMTLASLGLSKRWAAWALAALVAVLFLALPAGRVLDLPWKDAAQ